MIKMKSIDQFRHMIRTAMYLHSDHKLKTKSVSFEGTVKLHGTSGGICFVHNGDVRYQSKNRRLGENDDNMGFAKHMIEQEKNPLFDEFRDSVLNCVRNYKQVMDDVTVYGEWCGAGIQSGVGINKIGKKIFVVYGISVGNTKASKDDHVWMDASCLSGHFPELDIYNTHAFETFNIDVDLSYPEIAQEKLIEITNAVEKECPVAKAFGQSGVGEGVVWKPTTKGVENVGDLWFKVKGQKHSASKVKELAAVDVEKINTIKEFIEYAVTPQRLEQGIEVLKENNISIEMKNTGEYIRWVFNDVIKEESDTMAENGIEKKELGKYLNYSVREYWSKVINSV